MPPAKTRLPAKRRKALAVGLATIIDAVDSPDLVAALLDGTFQAIVDGGIRQMNAYAELIRDVASSIEAFGSDNVGAETARDRLVEKYGLLPQAAFAPKRKRKQAKQRRARPLTQARQQLLVSVLLMGINRIVVTDGQVKAKTRSR